MRNTNESEIIRIFRESGFTGSFKPTKKLTEMYRDCRDVDRFYFDPTTHKHTGDRSYNIWEEHWTKGEESNLIVVEGHEYDQNTVLAKLIRYLNPEYGITTVISIAAIPGKYAENKDFYYDYRYVDTIDDNKKKVGTAHFALDFLVAPKDYKKAMKILKSKPTHVNSVIRNLGVTFKGEPIDIYGAYFLDGDNSYKIEVRKIKYYR